MTRMESSGGAIAIFVKTPGRSAVKTRLAATIGEDAAWAWHLRAAAAVTEVAEAAAHAAGATAYFAVAEPAALDADPWHALPCVWQGEGGLGARMGRVHHELIRRHGSGVLLGADTPQLAPAMLGEALAWCRASEPRQAIGPARDGGFWLYAGNRAAPLATWESVAYSRTDTAVRLRAAFGAYGAFVGLPWRTDVDEEADLAVMRRELAALSSPTPAQRALAAWLDATRDGADVGKGGA